MRRVIAIWLFVSLLVGLRSFGVDLSKVDRKIGREPKYDEEPSYAFYGPVRVVPNARRGQAKVTVKLPGWNGIMLASPSFEWSVVD